MAHQPHTKSLPSPQAFTLKPPCQTGSTSFKIKTLVQACACRQLRHVVRALAHAKSMLMDLLPTKNDTAESYVIKLKRRRRKKKMFQAIRMFCTRSSSHVNPMPEPEGHAYYDSTWNSIIPTMVDEGSDGMEPAVLSGYLQWLEEKEADGSSMGDDSATENIDRLAEKFIQSCHEKFRLEKQESYRRYQEMLARSL